MAHDAVADDLSEIDSILDSNGVEAGLDMHWVQQSPSHREPTASAALP